MPRYHRYVGAKPATSAPKVLPYHVMIATPTTRDLCPSYTTAIIATVETLIRFGIQFDFFCLAEDCHVDDSRNLIIREFLKSECTDLIFIDSDMGWRSQDIIKLITSPGDIVAGVYRHKNDEETYPYHPGEGIREANENGLFEMPKAATGFMRIRRPVLEALFDEEYKKGRFSWPKAEKPGEDKPVCRIVERAFTFELGLNLPETDSTYHSGDYVLCLKARNLGFSVFIDVEMPFDHVGTKIWSGHFGNYLRKQQNTDHPYFVTAVNELAANGNDIAALEKLVGYSPYPPYALPANGLLELYEQASRARGHILECGTGLSTIIIGLALKGSHYQLYSLEHDIEWLNKTATWLKRYNITNVNLIYAPLHPFKDGNWYGIYPQDLPENIDIILLDGPPRSVSKREIAWDNIKQLLYDARVIIIDDCEDDKKQEYQEKAIDRNIKWIEGLSGNSKHLICIAEKEIALPIAAE